TVLGDLRNLPERQRAALLLRELSGLSHTEIAVALNTSVGAAKQAIFEARQGLLELEEGRAMRCDHVQRIVSAGDGRALRGRRLRAHLGSCASCATFAAAVPRRRAELTAVIPLLPAAAATSVLHRALGVSVRHGAGAPAAA